MTTHIVSSENGIELFDLGQLDDAINRFARLVTESVNGFGVSIDHDEVKQNLDKAGKHTFYEHGEDCAPTAVGIYVLKDNEYPNQFYNRALKEVPENKAHIDAIMEARYKKIMDNTQDRVLQVGDYIVDKGGEDQAERIGRIDVIHADNTMQVSFENDFYGYGRKYYLHTGNFVSASGTFGELMDIPSVDSFEKEDTRFAEFWTRAKTQPTRTGNKSVNIFAPTNVWRINN